MNIGLLQPAPRLRRTPARALNSPLSVVGTQIWRTRRAVLREAALAGDLVDHGADGAQPVRLADVVLEADGNRLASPSVVEPPPTLSSRSYPASRALLAQATTASRGLCAGMSSHPGIARAERVGDPTNGVRLAVERLAGQDEDPLGATDRRPRPPRRRPAGRTPRGPFL